MSPVSRSPQRHVSVCDARRRNLLAQFNGRPFTYAEGRKAGLIPSDFRSDAVVPITRGIYASAGSVITSLESQCAAYALCLPPGGRIAHVSAARLQQFPVPSHPRVFVSLPPGARMRRSEAIVLHHTSEQAVMALRLRSVEMKVPVTPPSQLVPECADRLGLVDLTVLADAILRHQPAALGHQPAAVAMRELWATNSRHIVRNAADHSVLNSESAMETRTRLLLELAGLPKPVTQHEVVVDGVIRRLDMAYPEVKVAVEYDGSYHYANEAQKQADILRDEVLVRDGWKIIRVVSVGIFRDPLSTIRRVEEALNERGARVTAHAGWRAHFAV